MRRFENQAPHRITPGMQQRNRTPIGVANQNGVFHIMGLEQFREDATRLPLKKNPDREDSRRGWNRHAPAGHRPSPDTPMQRIAHPESRATYPILPSPSCRNTSTGRPASPDILRTATRSLPITVTRLSLSLPIPAIIAQSPGRPRIHGFFDTSNSGEGKTIARCALFKRMNWRRIALNCREFAAE